MEDQGRLVACREGAIGWIVVEAQARRNAMRGAMWKALPGLVDAHEADPEVRVVILRGAGEQAFVSGADISEFGETRAGAANTAFVADVEAARLAFRRLTKPAIALIHGFCIGGGVVMALWCDIRMAADDAIFGVPPAKLGAGYEAEGVRQLVATIGPAFALELLATGERIDAREALRIGLVNHVLPKAELDARVRRMADQIAVNAPLSIRAARMAAMDALDRPGAPPAPEVQAAIDACFDSRDFAEGRLAFAEKRPPSFEGR